MVYILIATDWLKFSKNKHSYTKPLSDKAGINVGYRILRVCIGSLVKIICIMSCVNDNLCVCIVLSFCIYGISDRIGASALLLFKNKHQKIIKNSRKNHKSWIKGSNF